MIVPDRLLMVLRKVYFCFFFDLSILIDCYFAYSKLEVDKREYEKQGVDC